MPELQGSSGIAPANPSLGSKFPAIRENTGNCAILTVFGRRWDQASFAQILRNVSSRPIVAVSGEEHG